MSIKRRRFLIGAAGVTADAGMGLFAISSKEASLISGIARANPVASDTDLPESADVVVIGGGISGVSTALSLAERGISVILFEKGEIAGEASGRNHGQLALKFQDPGNLPLILHSLERWQQLNAITGEDTGYRNIPLYDFTNNERDVEALQAWESSADGLLAEKSQILTGAAVHSSLPGLAADYRYATWLPGEAVAEPQMAAPAIALGARKLGAKIFTRCAVRGVELSAGRVSSVVTERGTVKTQAVVVASGVWTPTLLGSMDITLPIFPGYASLLSLAPVDGGPRIAVALGKSGVNLRPQADGGYVVGATTGVAPILPSAFPYAPQLLDQLRHQSGTRVRLSVSNFWRELTTPRKWPLDRPSPFEEIRIYQPETQNETLDQVMRDLRAELPVFENAIERERWSGALTGTLDGRAVISAVENTPGLYIGAGYTWGFLKGPAVGDVLADLVMGETPKIPIEGYSLSRFGKG